MSILRRANESQSSDWLPVPEGVWRWRVGAPELVFNQKYNNWRVNIPLFLTDEEKQRLEEQEGETPAGKQQSWRANYRPGLSLGFLKDGQYVSTKLVDFLAACFGSQNVKTFRTYIASGGGPKPGTDEEETDNIKEWLLWWENLEVYGTITHAEDSSGNGKVWANFGGPLAVGSIPGVKDDAYQAIGRGKLRALMAESGTVAAPMPQAEAIPPAETAHPSAAPAKPATTARTYEEVFDDDVPFDQPAAA